MLPNFSLEIGWGGDLDITPTSEASMIVDSRYPKALRRRHLRKLLLAALSGYFNDKVQQVSPTFAMRRYTR